MDGQVHLCRGKDGDRIPDGEFSVNEDIANDWDLGEDDYDSEIDDPSTFREFESEVDEAEDTDIQQMIDAGFDASPKRRVTFCR